MTRKTRAALLGAAVFAVSLYYFSSERANFYEDSAKTQVRVATQASALPLALFAVADKNGYFADNNFKITILQNTSSGFALDALLKKDAEFAVVNDFSFAARAFSEKNIVIISTSAILRGHEIIARGAAGISLLRDLKGKKVGATPFGSEFALENLLKSNGLSLRDVRVVHLNADELQIKFTNGEIDALAAWSPTVLRLSQNFGPQAIVWRPGEASSAIYYLLVARKNWFLSNSNVALSMLKALGEAQDYIFLNSGESKKIFTKYFEGDIVDLDSGWEGSSFALALPRRLIDVLNLQADFILRHGLPESDVNTPNVMPQGDIPNYADFIDPSLLKSIRPSAVNID